MPVFELLADRTEPEDSEEEARPARVRGRLTGRFASKAARLAARVGADAGRSPVVALGRCLLFGLAISAADFRSASTSLPLIDPDCDGRIGQ